MNAILRSLCALPTAPFKEQAVIAWIRQFCRMQRLHVQEDRFGNLLVTLRPGSSRKPRWVFVAHTDHPGLEAVEMVGRGRLRARFRGGVFASHLPRTKVVFLDGTGAVRGTVIQATAGERGMAEGVTIRVAGDVAPGTPGMFDLRVARPKGKLLYNRAIDDLGGVASALQAMVNLRRSRKPAPVAALLTRGEEDGFVGAIAAAREEKLIRKSDALLSIECSAQQPVAQQGKGVVIRVGDRTSVFDSGLTYQITQLAEGLSKSRKGFMYQRALMPGGTCEATAFGAYGYRAAAVCVPLGNYHNMVPGKRQIAEEYIHLGDWQCLVDLLTAIGGQAPDGGLELLRERLDKRFARLRRHLEG